MTQAVPSYPLNIMGLTLTAVENELCCTAAYAWAFLLARFEAADATKRVPPQLNSVVLC